MLKKRILRTLGACFFGAFTLAVAAAPGYAWDEKIIDYETHLDKADLVQGSYTDWTGLRYPWATGNEWPYVYNRFARNTSQWYDTGNPQPRYGVAVWRVQIPRTGWYDLKASYKQTHNRTTAAQYYLYSDVTIADIKSYNTGDPIFHVVFNQNGDDAGHFNYVEFGAICMKAGEVSVLVLDARETERSSSADAAIWTYLGERYKSQPCVDAPPPSKKKVIAPLITPLLFKK
ncbi:MAG: hypothetical protein ACYC9M_12325 [Desulfobulbaceae bacterium]